MGDPMVRTVLFFAVLAVGGVSAQESASFRLDEHVFNAGGQPAAALSGSHRIESGAIGLSRGVSSGPGFSIEGGFVAAYRPPGEVASLLFSGAQTLIWQPERAVGDYALYEGSIALGFDPDFGSCLLSATSPTAEVATAVAPGDTLFYLVTARNRLGEEGTKGVGRANPAPCP